MKRRLALLPLLLAALPACAGGLAPPAAGPDGETEAYYESSVPLRARLLDGAGGLGIQLNTRAHVAVFEVVPGAGMGLMYPAHAGERSRVRSGFFRVPQNVLQPYTWFYARNGGVNPMGPRYYLLVASRAPLRIEGFQNDASAMREWFGLRRFAALNPRPAMDELVQTVVPAQADEDWDTDLLTVWPQDTRGLFNDRRLVRVVCGNGQVVTASWEAASVACRVVNNQVDPPAPPQRPDTLQPTPSDTVQVPTRRRPEPRSTDDGEASGDPNDVRREIPIRVERWQPSDDGGSLRRPFARPGEGGDDAGTPVVRRIPTRVEADDDDAGDREGVTRRHPGMGERGDGGDRGRRGWGRSGGTTGGETPRATPRERSPETTRTATPREAPPRAEPSRPQPSARPDPSPPASRPASSGSQERPSRRPGGDPR